MDENKDAVLDTDEIKEETIKTAKEVKETIKNVDFKNDAKATKGFITEMIKEPLERLKVIASGNDNKDFKFAIILVVIWVLCVGITNLSSYSTLSSFFSYGLSRHILSVIKAMAAPIVGLVAMSLVVFYVKKEEKKSFITILTALTAAKIPTIFARVLMLLTLISSKISSPLSYVSSFCSVMSTVFTFFALKELCGEEDNSKFFKKFIIIEAIYIAVAFAISYLEIYI